MSVASGVPETVGSSPLARGLPGVDDLGFKINGIIPARAGFTGVLETQVLDDGDHPRSRGVYSGVVNFVADTVGSSPLARGLLRRGQFRRRHGRIIPARAGFTPPGRFGGDEPQDHPRSRGVYSQVGSAGHRSSGSSPLARGLPAYSVASGHASGIIPARAGFTQRRPQWWRNSLDHPRSRGVYFIELFLVNFRHGSSPLARGLRQPPGRRRPGPGIIPARAGFTPSKVRLRPKQRDHPRSRGVYRTAASVHTPGAGSSPLARGLPGSR